jgi:hypothetical protein
MGGWCNGAPDAGAGRGCVEARSLVSSIPSPASFASAPYSPPGCYYVGYGAGLFSGSALGIGSNLFLGQTAISAMVADQQGLFVAWSLDGGVPQIDFFAGDGGCGRSSVTLVTSASVEFTALTFDGQMLLAALLATADGGSDGQIWQIAPDGGGFISLATGLGRITSLAYERSIDDVAFLAGDGGVYRLNRHDGGVSLVWSSPQSPAVFLASGNQALYWATSTDVHETLGDGGSTTAVLGLNVATGLGLYEEGAPGTPDLGADALLITTSDGELFDWHSMTAVLQTIGTGQGMPELPTVYGDWSIGSPLASFAWHDSQTSGFFYIYIPN